MATGPLDRRSMLGFLGAGGLALVAGFDPVGRRWITAAEASGGCPTFMDVPPLDGVLLLDDASRAADSKDKGNIIHQPPCAVLRPESVRDVQRMIRYCRRYDVKVAVRGQAHTMFGQSLSPGLVIENGTLNRIHSIGPEGADVDAGVRWKDLIIAAYDQRLTPPVITGYTNLSISGTLSVGGISGRNYAGAQVDHVRALDVVTGEGNFRRCSMHENRDLFEVMLAGLGQCGVMTRAKMDLVPAKSKARLYNINYADNATFFRDLRTLINRRELNECFSLWVPQFSPTPGYQIQAVAYFDDANPPNDAYLMRGLSVPADQIPHRDFGYLEWVLSVDAQIDFLRATFAWDDFVKPWFDVWLPERTVEQYVGEVMPTLTAEDIGPFGFLLIFPLHKSALRRPFFRLPTTGRREFVYLFDILTVAPGPGPNPAFAEAMLARNRRLFEKAREAGGTRYPIGALEFKRQDWARQYGELWPEFVERKQRFDPDNILSPGSGIF